MHIKDILLMSYVKTKWLQAVLILISYSVSVHATPVYHSDINKYIQENWQTLQRSISNCRAYDDTKIGASHFLYLPYQFPMTAEIRAIQKKCHIQINYLPRKIYQLGDVKTNTIHPHGLLYLPNSYVVPGGRFNEMYGWDSYFIILGLLHSGNVKLANNMLENYFFELKYYGAILNANRTYHLSRSQPPFLTSSILALYHALNKQGMVNRQWLLRAYHFAQQEHAQWTSPAFLAGDTGLSRYYDNEDGRLIETKAYDGYYDNVYKFIQLHPEQTMGYLNLQAPVPTLSNDFYRGERSLRASGFDITNRFGPFGGRTHHYAAVCLNSLLYKTEKDLAQIARLLGKESDARKWGNLANKRKIAMNQYLYNSISGLFVDYDFMQKQQSTYHYASTFYPLWAGLATKQQATSIEKNLSLFEQTGGIAMSDQDTGLQWDKPFGWAPIQLLVVQGLLNYGYNQDAVRIAKKFNTVVIDNFNQTQRIFEKYDVVTGKTTSKFLGYKGNAIGFGWTNATFLLFQDVLKLDGLTI